MCFTIFTNDYKQTLKEFKVSDGTVEIYKVVTSNKEGYNPPYYNKHSVVPFYVIGEIKEAKDDSAYYEKIESSVFSHDFYQGYDSDVTGWLEIHAGIHGVKTLALAINLKETDFSTFDKIVKFTLPEGTKYYENETEIVCEKVLCVEEIKN